MLVIGYDSIDYACRTDVGMRRSHNQDAHSALLATDDDGWRQRGHVFLVADGMGAHAVGELASELAITTIPHTYHKHAPQTGISALRRAFAEANASIHGKGQANKEFEGMGTTGTALVLRPEGVWVGHVGDSRAYRIRNNKIEQLSFDHSLLWMIAKKEGVDPDQLQGIPHNVIVRSLGPEALVQIDMEGPHPIEPGDYYLLCSDGLSGQVSDAEIGAIVSVLPPAEACHFLVDLANLRGGPDNITVIVVQVKQSAARKSKEMPILPFYRRIPWPLATLLAGLLLAGSALFLALNEQKGLGVPLFLLSACAIVIGLIGLALHYRHEQEQLAREPRASRTRPYRSTPCPVDDLLVEKLTRAIGNLDQQVADKPWEVDQTAFEKHREQAAEHKRKTDLQGACREYCRAMLVLTETVSRHRTREESFQPVWDKS